MTRIQTKQISLNLWYPEFILPALRDTTHVTVIPAGRQIGKTQNTAQWLIDETMKLGVQTLWVDTVHGNIDKYVKRIFLPILSPVIRYVKWHEQKKILELPRGGIDFGSAQKPENLEGFNYPRAVLNEAGHILKKESLWYNTLGAMIKDMNNQTKVIGTPKGKGLFSKLYEKGVAGDPGYASYRYTVFDSPFWNNEQIESVRVSTPTAIFNQEYLASFEDFVGLIYPDFNHERHMTSYPDKDIRDIFFIGIDIGWTNPTAILLMKEDINHNVYVLDEIQDVSLDAPGISRQIQSILIRNDVKKTDISSFIIDPASRKTESTSTMSMFDQLVEEGWPLVSGNNDVLAGISRVTRLLKENKLFFTNKCEKLRQEIEEYHWKEVPEDSDQDRNRPFKVKDHSLDALRYVVMSRPDYFEHPRLDPYGRVVSDTQDITYQDPEEDDIIDIFDQGGDLMDDGGSIY